MIDLSNTRARLAGATVLALGIVAVAAPSAGATAASATLTAGSLGFVSAPAAVTFPSTAINGLNQSVSASQLFDTSDATGSSAGWNITATSTTFTSGSNTLATSSTTIPTAPAAPTCDTGSTCTVATAVGVTYPYTLPAGTTAPTATKMFAATAGTGMGNQSLTPSWALAIPSKAVAGTYTSTWTLSLVSGP